MLRRSWMPLCAAVTLESVGQHGRLVTLAKEKSLNALNVPMVLALKDYYADFHKAPANSLVVVLQGAGTKAFCAGGDVVAIVKDEPKGSRQKFFYDEYQADHFVATLKQPHIALWQGIVMGGGVGISVHGKYRVACDKTLFAMPETGIGLFPDVGGSWALTRLPHDGLGMYLALTGARLKGADVFHSGLATHYVGSINALGPLRDRLLQAAPADVDTILKEGSEANPKPFSLQDKLPIIAEVFGQKAQSVEHILDALDKQKDSEWAQEQSKTLEKMSPSSLKISFECQRRAAKHKSIEETFAMEYNVVQRCMDTGDFDAGVTALLIDKTGEKPRWHPEELSGVSAELVESYFRAPSKAPVWHPTKPFEPHSAKL
jgi:3-hydroxyisobutyryl-CoA hydrolase